MNVKARGLMQHDSERDSGRGFGDDGLFHDDHLQGEAEEKKHPLRVVICATFTADLVVRPLKTWMEILDIPTVVTLAPYGQVMQELLNPHSLFARNGAGFNILLIRIDDWSRDRRPSEGADLTIEHLRTSTHEFCDALCAFLETAASPVLLFLCPPSSRFSNAHRAAIERIQEEALARLATQRNIQCFTHEQLLRLYPVAQYADDRSDQIAHIPYSPGYFSAVATLLSRRIAASMKPRYKVIAVDCDNTLWKGVCGEDGVDGIILTRAHLDFQKLLVRQYEAGVLLCLCSKNNERDIEEVFRKRPEMPLRKEHIVAWRVNWQSKSENLRALSAELGLSMDSFIFVDDSPMECEEVRANCPEALTLVFPGEPTEVQHFIDHVWAFDQTEVTEEARARTQKYRENRERRLALEKRPDLAGFLASLDLRVQVSEMRAENLTRVEELVQRTNQFNLTTIRRRANEITALCANDAVRCLVVHVRDRFGDYGLVGVVLLRLLAEAVDVDTLLLSCRVLGRGVERQVVAEIGRIALREGRTHVLLRYRRTPRNAPAWEFLRGTFDPFEQARQHDQGAQSDSVFRIPAEHATSLELQGQDAQHVSVEPAPRVESGASKNSAAWHKEAYRLSRITDFMQEMKSGKVQSRESGVGRIEARNSNESTITAIFEEVLGLTGVDVRASFFDLGGDSVLAVRVMVRIESILGLELSLVDFFDAPTIEGIARRLETATSAGPQVRPAERTGPVPLSYAQERLWFLDQMGLVGAAYNIPLAIRLAGELDENALQCSFTALARRHESLRTRFASRDGVPHQVIDPSISIELHRLDLSEIADALYRDQELRKRIQREQLHRFDLAIGPLLRTVLVKLGAREYVLLVTIHHIVSDGWSIGVLIRELGITYSAHVVGNAAALPDLKIQYADYAIWQRESLEEEVLRTQLRYWKGRLAGAPPQLELPTDRPRPATESFKGNSIRFRLPAKLLGDLREIASGEGATLFMVMLAAYQLLLYRWSGQGDIVVGSPIAGRRNREVEALIGFFVNTLALRTELSDSLTFLGLLRRVKEHTLGAYANQDIPFDTVVTELRPERTLSRQPIFQVMLAMQNYPEEELRMPGLTWSWGDLSYVTTHFDLTLYLYHVSDGIVGVAEYAADLFDQSTIERMMLHFRRLLDAIAAAPDSSVGRMPLLSDEETRQILTLWNETSRSYPRNRCVHELFGEQAKRAPDRPAVSWKSHTLTYAALDAWADRIAHRLSEFGVGPNAVVGVRMKRSMEMIVAFLGILKSGGAYLPLDPDDPAERTIFMIQQSSVSVILTSQECAEPLPSGVPHVICVEHEGSDAGARLNHCPKMHPDCLAYVLYTSGSTGLPKAVGVTHRNIVRLLVGTDYIDVDERDVFLQLAAPAFDASTFEIWGALLNAAQLVLYPDRDIEIDRLQQVLLEGEVTVLWLTAGLFHQVVAERPQALTSLKWLLAGGDRLQPAQVTRALEFLPTCRLINGYGPTEATTFSVCHEIKVSDDMVAGVSIGRPIANTRTYVLDRLLQPVPIGINGELYIGGDGLARGYLANPELTSLRFVANPFEDAGARLYRTGDVVRWTRNGVLEFIGRSDDQVKIRGFRIEPAEIEAVVKEYPAVTQCSVLSREDQLGERRLVCYVVADRRQSLRAESERDDQKLRSVVVDEWEVLYDQTYGTPDSSGEPSFIGWNSSYTGEPIPEEQMQEWLAGTLSRIRALRPNRVLEIGCGVGLLVQQLAPGCSVYVGTDFSQSAIAQLKRWTSRHEQLKHVDLQHRSAIEFAGFEEGFFDTVILNSVVQYFPDMEYLLAVLRGAISVLKPGGNIYVGDVRNLSMLPSFHSAVQLGKASASLKVGQLRRRIARAIAQDKELVIDPQFFFMLPGNVAGICAAEVALKRGKSANELTRHRYDVTLRVGDQLEPRTVYVHLSWDAQSDCFDAIESALRRRSWRAVQLRGVPNGRLAREAGIRRLIETADQSIEVGILRRRAQEASFVGVDPEELWEMSTELGYDTVLTPGQGESFDAYIVERAAHDTLAAEVPPAEPWKSPETYANDPLEHGYKREIVSQLRAYVSERLPKHMIPSAWVVLKSMPLTSNGKVDRRALPVPEGRPEEMGDYVAPRTNLERLLAEVWTELLSVDQVGITDNFFELGGHSLLIVQLMERLRRRGLSIPVRSIYEHPTLEVLASLLKEEKTGGFDVPPNLIPGGCTFIVPEMLPLIQLEQQDIDMIMRCVPGGAANIQDIYPLTSLQEGLLFHHILDQESGDTYVVSTLLSVGSRERLDELLDVLQRMIDRHDILRTAVLWEGLPQAVQVVYRSATMKVHEIALDRARDIDRQLAAWMAPRREKLDLRYAPLMQAQIAADPSGELWYLLLQLHHSTVDHEAMDTLLSEVITCLRGRSGELREVTAYREHVAQSLAHAGASASEAFFRAKLRTVDEPTAPFGLLNVHSDGSRIDRVERVCDELLARRIRGQARKQGVSPATLFHAAWSIVVSRTSGRDDVVYGAPLLGRLQGNVGAKRALGLFINMLPVRLQLRDRSVMELLTQTQRELVDLLSHEHASLAVAQRCSGVRGSTPLFSALLNYRHTVDLKSHLASAGITLHAMQSFTNYPVVMSVDELDEGFILDAQTDPRVDAERLIEYTLTAMRSVLDALDADPHAPALSLTILPGEERRQITQAFNATRTEYPRQQTIHQLFEAQVRRTPAAIAVVFEGQHVSYEALNAKADELARRLVSWGIKPGECIPLVMPRSLEAVVAQLAILKCGGVYVPMDPSMPLERQAFIVRDCGARLGIADCPAAAPEQASVHWVGSNEAPNDGAALLWIGSPLLDSPLSPAYVMYTSGSTGVPKGVLVPHRAVIRLVRDTDYVRIGVADCIAHCSNPSFDASTFEIWGALLNGARVVILPQAVVLESERLVQAIRNEGVTVLFMTIGLFNQYIDALASVFGQLKYLLTGGDIVDPGRMRQVLRSSRPKTLLSAYGPTETTTFATTYNVDMLDMEAVSVPVGRPISNTTMYILDTKMEPVPIGVAGEIYIGGDGVALGYFGRPSLTAERFLPDPFDAGRGARLYRSGDIGRWQANGNIEFLGRNDSQVKVRGFRVELGEIEARLVSNPQVKQAVVAALEDSPREKRLVAYFVAAERVEPSIEELRSHISAALPDYMIPSAFVRLHEIPLTPNGKVDRRALPAPDLGAFVSRGYEAPQNEVEQQLADIWRELLRVDRIGRHDNFFELGGHSLLIMQMMERLRRVGLSATMRSIFDSSSLAELATLLARGDVDHYRVPPNQIPDGCTKITPQMLSLIELHPEDIDVIASNVEGGERNIQDIYPLTPLQEGVLFHHLLSEGRGDAYVLPMLMTMDSEEGLRKFIKALQVVIDRHDVLRSAVLWKGLPRPVQVVLRAARLNVEEFSLDSDREGLEQVQQRLNSDAARVDLARAPLIRLQVSAEASNGRRYAVVYLHLLICDHESVEIIFSEIMECFQGRKDALKCPMPYRNHVAQALEHARTHDAESFFRGKLSGIDEPTAPFGVLEVHGDGSGIQESVENLEIALVDRIRAQARRLGVSAAALFHAGWALVVACTSDRDDVVFGTVLLGRLQGSAGAQQILGMFVNTLPLRLKLRGQTAIELVERTQRELVELLTHEQASLALAQQCSEIRNSVPLFTSLMNYRHGVANASARLESDELKLVAMKGWTNYPITMTVDDAEGCFTLVAQTDHRIDPVCLTRCLRTVMESLVEVLESAPRTSALALQVLPRAEYERMTHLSIGGRAESQRGTLLHHFFEDQARRTPEAVAILHDRGALTYAELNERANRLACVLLNRNVGSDDLVGIFIDHSIDAVTAVLGVLKAGAAYLPLDPSYPPERTKYILADADPRIVLTRQELLASLSMAGDEVVAVDGKHEGEVGDVVQVLSAVDQKTKPENLAYVIYTSGSSGYPKSTGMSHAALVNLLTWHRQMLPCEGQRVAQCASLSFDVATQEIFSTLGTGGTLVLISNTARRDARALLQHLAEQRVERLFAPPAMLLSLAEAQQVTNTSVTSLRDVIAAGEQLRISAQIVTMFNRLKGCRLHNHYGPTETHVVTSFTLDGDPDHWPEFPSIGIPISNTRIYVLGRSLQPVPAGVTGEIYVAGPGVRGYLGVPQMTAQRFIANPFGISSGERLYRTGDLGRWRADATLEYRGRTDNQVKIRGFRIELGEIEAHLARHEKVKESAVVVFGDVLEERRLVGYVTTRDQVELRPQELRDHLSGFLPSHMIPSALMVLDAMPRTTSGKLDRRTLPEPERDAYVGAPYEAPQGEAEQALAMLWQRLLRLPRVGRNDNFFELGGHSLVAIKLAAQLPELTVAAIYGRPTLQLMAQAIGSPSLENRLRLEGMREPTVEEGMI